MNALVYNDAWDVGLRAVPTPTLKKPNDVKVRIRASTVCGTDVGIIAGLYEAKKPVILGHESSGEVCEIGPEAVGVRIGDRVAIDPTYFCGRCWMCNNGNPNHCEEKLTTETGVSRDGTFTDFYVTEDRFLYPLPDHVTFEESCLTEPLSCVMTGVKQLKLRTNLDTVVVGGGPIGMLYCHALHLHGVRGALVELSEERRALCADLLPSGWIVCSSMTEAAGKLRTRTNGYDLIVDACGAAAKEAISLLNRCGQLLLVGLRRCTVEFDPMQVADRSQRIIGSIDSVHTFGESLQLIVSGRVPAKRLISKEFALGDYDDAFALLGCDIGSRTRTNTAAAMKVALKS